MAIVKKDYVFKLMEEQNLPYFQVTDGRVMIAVNDDEAETKKAVELLQDAIAYIEDGYVVIKLSNENRNAKKAGRPVGLKQFEFKVNLGQPQQGLNGMGNVIGYIEQISDLKRQLEMTGYQKQIDDLKKKIEEKNSDSQLDKYMPLIMGFLNNGKPIAVAGTEDAPIQENLTEQQERNIEYQKKIKLAIIRLSKVDKQLDSTLGILADFAEKKPTEYLSFIPVVKGMV